MAMINSAQQQHGEWEWPPKLKKAAQEKQDAINSAKLKDQGLAALEEGRLRDAERLISQALGLNVQDAEAFFALGKA